MVDNAEKAPYQDEVIFSARYSPFKVWLSIIAACTFPLAILVAGAYFAFATKDYLSAFLLLFLVSVILLFSLEAIFFEQLLFYHNRVTKVWYLFGEKTIPYSSASVLAPEWYMRLLSSSYMIFESRDNGKPVPMRLPIIYHAFFFPAETAKKVETLMDYVTEDKENNPRKFRKFTLPKEVICPS